MIIQSINEAKIAARGDYRIIRRNGAVVAFDPAKIARAMNKAYMAVAESYKVERSPAFVVAASVPLDEGSDTSGASPGAGGESGGDGDDDGDGDGDGPRRSRHASPPPKIRNTPAVQRLPRCKSTQVTTLSPPTPGCIDRARPLNHRSAIDCRCSRNAGLSQARGQCHSKPNWSAIAGS